MTSNHGQQPSDPTDQAVLREFVGSRPSARIAAVGVAAAACAVGLAALMGVHPDVTAPIAFVGAAVALTLSFVIRLSMLRVGALSAALMALGAIAFHASGRSVTQRPVAGAAAPLPSELGRLQGTSQRPYAIFYYKGPDGIEHAADCSPVSEVISVPAGRYLVRIDGAARPIVGQRVVQVSSGHTTYVP